MADAIEFDFIGKNDVSNVLRDISASMDGVVVSIDQVNRAASATDAAFTETSRVISDAVSVFTDLRNAMSVTDASTSAVIGNMRGLQETMAEAVQELNVGADTFATFTDGERLSADAAQALTDMMLSQAQVLADVSNAAMDQIRAIDSMGESERAAAGDTTLLRAALADTVISADDTIQAFDGIQASGRVTEQVMQGMADVIKSVADTAKLAGDVVSSALGQRLTVATSAAARATEVLQGVNKDTAASEEKVATSADVESGALARVTAALEKVAAASRATATAAAPVLSGSLDKARVSHEGLITSLAGGINHLAGSALELGINATLLDQFGYAAIKGGLSFQQQMAINKNLAATTKDNINDMTNALIAAAGPWGRTPAELAQGLYFAMSDGFHGADAMNVLKSASQGASGGLGSFADMVKGITTLMNDFGVTSGQAVDMVLRTVTSGRMTLEEFVNNLGKVAPYAATSGYSLEAYTVALDAMSRAGIGANQQATYLRSAMMSLGGNEVGVSDKAKGMGITISAATLEMMKQHDGANALADQLKYVSDQTRAWAYSHYSGAEAAAQYQSAMLKLTGGVRSGAAAAAISARGFENFHNVMKNFNSIPVSGPAHMAAMFATLPGALLQLHGALGGLQAAFVKAIGPYLGPMIGSVVIGIEKLTARIQTMNPASLQRVAQGFLLLAGIINGGAIAAVGALMLKFTGVTGILGLLGKHLDGAGKATEGAAKEAGKFGKIMQTVFGSWGSTIIGPLEEGTRRASGWMGMIHRGGDAGRRFGDALLHPSALLRTVTGSFKGLFDVIGGGGVGILEKLSGGFFKLASADLSLPNIINMVRGSFLGLGRAALGLLPALMGMAGAALPIIGILLLVVGVVAIVILAFTKFRTQTMAALQPLITEFRSVFGAIMGMVMLAVKEIQTSWNSMWPQIRPAMLQFLNAVKQMGPVWQVLGTIIKVVAAVIIGAVVGLVNGFLHALPFVISFFTGLVMIITGVFQIIKGIFTLNGNLINQGLGNVFGGIVKIVVSAFGAVLAFIGGAIQGIIGWFNKLTHGALSGVLGFVNGIVKWFQHLADVLVGHSIIPDMINSIVRFITGLPGKILGIIAGLVGQVIGHFARLGTQVAGNMLKLGSNIIHAASSLPGPVGAVFGLLAHTIDGQTHIAQLTSDMHMNQMKARTLMHTAQMESGAAQHARSMAQQLLVEAAHTKDGHLKHILEMRAQSLMHIAALHQGAAVHAAQMAHEVQAHAAQEAAQVKAEHERMKGGVIGAVGSMVASAVGSIASGMGTFVGHVASGAGQVLSKMQSLPGQIVGALSGLGGQLAGVAGNAMDSMAGAIRDAAGRLGQAAAGVVGGIIHAAKDALGIKSPSTVFLEIGHHTMLGMAHGITTGGALAVDATHDSTQRIVAAARKGIASGQQALIATGGQGVAGARAGGATAGGGGGDIHLHLEGGLGAGLQLLNPTDRRRFAQQVAKELSLNTGIQGIQPLGYSGRGTI